MFSFHNFLTGSDTQKFRVSAYRRINTVYKRYYLFPETGGWFNAELTSAVLATALISVHVAIFTYGFSRRVHVSDYIKYQLNQSQLKNVRTNQHQSQRCQPPEI